MFLYHSSSPLFDYGHEVGDGNGSLRVDGTENSERDLSRSATVFER